MNYYPERYGSIEELDKRLYTTSELVQRHLEGSSVVKAFHNLDQFHFRYGPRPENDPERWALPIAGDNANAKEEVSTFMTAIGFDPVDCGSLAADPAEHAAQLHPSAYIGELPETASPRELYEWVKQDHSQVVKTADIRALAATVNSGRAGQLFSDFPSEYGALFSMKFDE